jgi:subtilase family serine protease
MKSHVPVLKLSFLIAAVGLCSITDLAQIPTVRARVTEAVNPQNRITLRGNVHPLARPEFDQGVAPDDLPMRRMLLVLQRAPEQESALRQLLDDQQVKDSARYHQWLTPEQFGQQFGPADSDIQAVTDWLTKQGFQVAKAGYGRTVIEFSGTVGVVRQALRTEIHKFVLDGKDYWANTSDPQIPAALVPVVAGFASLNNFPKQLGKRPINAFSRSKATGEITPLFTFPSNGTNYYAVTPMDFATIYNVLPLWNVSTSLKGSRNHQSEGSQVLRASSAGTR